jgi:hypothetical protein
MGGGPLKYFSARVFLSCDSLKARTNCVLKQRFRKSIRGSKNLYLAEGKVSRTPVEVDKGLPKTNRPR